MGTIKWNKIGEEGRAVTQGFEYNSGNNEDWLTHNDLLKMVEDMGPM
jgi:UDP-N-acetylglucosamine 4,6-dehydratase